MNGALLISHQNSQRVRSSPNPVGVPVTYAVVGWLKRREGVEVFDTATDFSPFAKAEQAPPG